MPTIHLQPPLISEDHLAQKIICIRAHRERIFRVEPETMNNKIIFHNYGQGGAGWTFLFGCVATSLQQFQGFTAHNPPSLTCSSQLRWQRSRKLWRTGQPIAVIGAGCYGLLTAIMLKRAGYQVRIVAKETDTISSFNAAGFFFPRARKSSTPHERSVFESTGMSSYKTYLAIARGAHPFIQRGAQLLPAYYSPDIDPEFGFYINQGLMEQPQEVHIDFGKGKKYAMNAYQTIFMDSTVLMQELHRNQQELDIPISQQEIQSFDEIPESLIFNCAGLGTRQLTDDKRIVPVQGHLITLTQQSSQPYMINAKVVQQTAKGTPRDELIYYTPKGSGIVGITFIRGQDSTTTNYHEFDRLLERCQQFFGKP